MVLSEGVVNEVPVAIGEPPLAATYQPMTPAEVVAANVTEPGPQLVAGVVVKIVGVPIVNGIPIRVLAEQVLS